MKNKALLSIVTAASIGLVCSIGCRNSPVLRNRFHMMAAVTPAPKTNSVVWFGWDRSNDQVTSGYFLLWGSNPGRETNRVDVGNTNAAMLTLPLGTSYIVCQGYSTNGLVSPWSNEAHFPLWCVVTVTGTNVVVSRSLGGPWASTNSPWTYTNPTGVQFFKGRGRVVIKSEMK